MSSVRIGHVERERAVEHLKTAYTEGRLDSAEFDARVERAMQARTQDDLGPLLADLPALVEIPDSRAIPETAPRSRIVGRLRAAAQCVPCCGRAPSGEHQQSSSRPADSLR